RPPAAAAVPFTKPRRENEFSPFMTHPFCVAPYAVGRWSANSTPPTALFTNCVSWIVITTRSAGTLQVSTTTSVIPLHSARFCSIDRPSFSSIVISGIVVLRTAVTEGAQFASYPFRNASLFPRSHLTCVDCDETYRSH